MRLILAARAHLRTWRERVQSLLQTVKRTDELSSSTVKNFEFLILFGKFSLSWSLRAHTKLVTLEGNFFFSVQEVGSVFLGRIRIEAPVSSQSRSFRGLLFWITTTVGVDRAVYFPEELPTRCARAATAARLRNWKRRN